MLHALLYPPLYSVHRTISSSNIRPRPVTRIPVTTMNISIPGAHLPGALNRGSGRNNGQTLTWTNRILQKLPPTARGHIVAAIGEFAGTIFFLFFAFAGTQVANISSNDNTGSTIVTTVKQANPSQLLYISLSFGFSLAVNAWVYFRISGGLFNPAVSIVSFGPSAMC
jgi:hypothetical protein